MSSNRCISRTEPNALMKSVGERHEELATGLERFADMGRRPLRLAVRDLEWQLEGADLFLQFTLTRGGYATSVFREFCEWR